MVMDQEDQEVVKRFLAVSEALGLTVTSPFKVTDIDGKAYYYLLHIEDFGSPSGILIACNTCPSGNSREQEFALSLLGPESVRDIDSIKAELEDWGWHGNPAQQPEWLSKE
jgi:hypothetical protein